MNNLNNDVIESISLSFGNDRFFVKLSTNVIYNQIKNTLIVIDVDVGCELAESNFRISFCLSDFFLDCLVSFILDVLYIEVNTSSSVSVARLNSFAMFLRVRMGSLVLR